MLLCPAPAWAASGLTAVASSYISLSLHDAPSFRATLPRLHRRLPGSRRRRRRRSRCPFAHSLANPSATLAPAATADQPVIPATRGWRHPRRLAAPPTHRHHRRLPASPGASSTAGVTDPPNTEPPTRSPNPPELMEIAGHGEEGMKLAGSTPEKKE
uniref:Uncharacterized protein n=1 Tax=Setaria viridis TaxID=4556 RepID=A0A4U6U7I1_SETVI|nr:hypothetical protein SEVIR_6G209000v2 [Setaria viridis]